MQPDAKLQRSIVTSLHFAAIHQEEDDKARCQLQLGSFQVLRLIYLDWFLVIQVVETEVIDAQ